MWVGSLSWMTKCEKLIQMHVKLKLWSLGKNIINLSICIKRKTSFLGFNLHWRQNISCTPMVNKYHENGVLWLKGTYLQSAAMLLNNKPPCRNQLGISLEVLYTSIACLWAAILQEGKIWTLKKLLDSLTARANIVNVRYARRATKFYRISKFDILEFYSPPEL